MLDWNDTITFTRYSNVVVSAWSSGMPSISSISEPAYLQVAVAGITPGTLSILGKDEANANIMETLSFTGPATFLTSIKFKSVSGLTPSWSSYSIDVKAVDVQGAPVNRSIPYGPYMCSVEPYDTSFTAEDRVGSPGIYKGQVWRVYIQNFQPISGDAVVTGRGFVGLVADCRPSMALNYPIGWTFFVVQNPG